MRKTTREFPVRCYDKSIGYISKEATDPARSGVGVGGELGSQGRGQKRGLMAGS